MKNRNGDFYHVYVNRDMKREEREKEIKERKERNRRMYGDSAAGAGLRTETNHRGELDTQAKVKGQIQDSSGGQ